MTGRILLWAYGLLIAANLVSVATDNKTLEWITKPLLMPVLIGYFFAVRAHRATNAMLMVAGLAAATVADIALLIEGDLAFLVGMGFFLVMQGCYITAFLRLNAHRRLRKAVWVLSVFGLFWGAFNVTLWNEFAELAVPIAIYSLALTAMAVLATGLSNRLGLGGVLFLLSDFLIGVGVAGTDFVGRGVLIMAFYTAAQYLLVSGWIAQTDGAANLKSRWRG